MMCNLSHRKRTITAVLLIERLPISISNCSFLFSPYVVEIHYLNAVSTSPQISSFFRLQTGATSFIQTLTPEEGTYRTPQNTLQKTYFQEQKMMVDWRNQITLHDSKLFFHFQNDMFCSLPYLFAFLFIYIF